MREEGVACCSMRGALGFAAWLDQEPLKCRSWAIVMGYMPIQLVAPSAVRMADAIEAIS